jgi:hypothetical protein
MAELPMLFSPERRGRMAEAKAKGGDIGGRKSKAGVRKTPAKRTAES